MIQGHLCTDWQDGQYVRTRNIEDVRRSFEHLLTDTGFGYIDIGMIHYCDTLDDLKSILTGDVMAYVESLKGQGVLRCNGLSTHNPDVVMQAVASGEIDVIMMSVNPAYDMLPASEDVDILFQQKTYDRVYAGDRPKAGSHVPRLPTKRRGANGDEALCRGAAAVAGTVALWQSHDPGAVHQLLFR